MEIKQRIGKNIRKFRLDKWYSQEQFAVISKFHRTYISLVERWLRNISVENLEKIANALDISITDLLQ